MQETISNLLNTTTSVIDRAAGVGSTIAEEMALKGMVFGLLFWAIAVGIACCGKYLYHRIEDADGREITCLITVIGSLLFFFMGCGWWADYWAPTTAAFDHIVGQLR